MNATERRYDIDWLRVVAIGLLLIYHAAIVFQPWGVFIGFIQSNEPMEWLWIPMSMLNVWRIPLLFFVSGMGVCFAIGKRNWKQLIGERSRRILMPFLFGMIAIVPLHELMWQAYYSQEIAYSISRGHLWFLGNIFAYLVLLFPVFYYLKNNAQNNLALIIEKIMAKPFSVLLVALPFVGEVVLVNPEAYEMYALSWHGFYLGFLAFLFGFIMVYVGQPFWLSIKRWRWVYFTSAMLLFLVRLLIYELQPPSFLLPIESISWIYTIFAFAYKYLNRPSTLLTYLSKAAYPIYIMHMFFLFLSAKMVLPLSFSVELKLLIVTLASFLGALLVFELLIRRFKLIGALLGYSRK